MAPGILTGEERHARTDRLIGRERRQSLANARVLVVGIGGVGGACALTLGRLGIGRLTMIDGDVITPSNLNRQWVALTSTIGRPKAEVAKEMIGQIDPAIEVVALLRRVDGANASQCVAGHDVVVDAIDDRAAKVALAVAARDAGIPMIASMGAGNRLDPTRFRVGDVYETHTDPLARAMRRAYREAGIERLAVVWSDETPALVAPDDAGGHAPASVATVPPRRGIGACRAGAFDPDETGRIARQEGIEYGRNGHRACSEGRYGHGAF